MGPGEDWTCEATRFIYSDANANYGGPRPQIQTGGVPRFAEIAKTSRDDVDQRPTGSMSGCPKMSLG
jgi:hypothetical protein